MDNYILSFDPSEGPFGNHDASAAIFRNGSLDFAVEEGRLIREKRASTFPFESIRACLESCDIELSEVDEIVIPWVPELRLKTVPHLLKRERRTHGTLAGAWGSLETLKDAYTWKYRAISIVEQQLRKEFGEPLPPITTKEHHACHIASAFHPSPFDSALGLTIDGKGEYDSTVVWKCTPNGMERIRTYQFPNSLGRFYGGVTTFLGYHFFNGAGKVMGLAPYGSENESIEGPLREILDIGVDYDVTPLTKDGYGGTAQKLEKLFGRESSTQTETFTQWEKDLAFTTQKLLEEIVVDIIATYTERLNLNDVVLAGGVALNCKMNKQIMELPDVNLFIQPVAHDAGLAIGGGYVDQSPLAVEPMSTVYWGPEYDNEAVKAQLEENKIPYRKPDDLLRVVAEKLADGEIVGWFQGGLEMGPRALGNRSILADPRSEASRDNVNKYVKHREGWRPFAPSMLESATEKYLENPEPSPYMIKTFDTVPEHRDEIEAVLHPGDLTTRPQTVNEEDNPRYHALISEFESITGVPVVLNTSFNDGGEPIVNEPVDALKDFYGMGLDALVIEDFLMEKAAVKKQSRDRISSYTNSS